MKISHLTHSRNFSYVKIGLWILVIELRCIILRRNILCVENYFGTTLSSLLSLTTTNGRIRKWKIHKRKLRSFIIRFFDEMRFSVWLLLHSENIGLKKIIPFATKMLLRHIFYLYTINKFSLICFCIFSSCERNRSIAKLLVFRSYNNTSRKCEESNFGCRQCLLKKFKKKKFRRKHRCIFSVFFNFESLFLGL